MDLDEGTTLVEDVALSKTRAAGIAKNRLGTQLVSIALESRVLPTLQYPKVEDPQLSFCLRPQKY